MKDDKEYEFEFPQFDEEEFKGKEKRKAKTSFISFGFGIVMGIICHFAWISISPSLRWGLTFLLAICSIGFLAKIFQLLKIDISKFERKDWLGSIAFYFFTWLAIFIISINPPFYDVSPPKIDAVALPEIQEVGENILIVAKVTDNIGVSDVYLNITYGTNSFTRRMESNENLVYSYSFPDPTNQTEKDMANQAETYIYTITARDKRGNTRIWENGKFSFEEEVIKISEPDNGAHISASTNILIRVKKDILTILEDEESRWKNIRVFYMINDQNEINATYFDSFGDYYVYNTSAQYQGWEAGKENTLRPYVEVEYYVLSIELNQSRESSHNVIESSEIYRYSVENEEEVGKKTSESIKMPGPKSLRGTPGFEAFAFLLAIIALLIFRKRK